jgi:urease accessory protein
VFGRAARQETVTEGYFSDRWRIWRGGKLIYADNFRLEGPIDALLRKRSVANGHRAIATFVHVAPDAASRLEAARTFLDSSSDCEVAASAWNGLLAVRFCAVTIDALRRAAIRFLIGFRGAPMPRVWLS